MEDHFEHKDESKRRTRNLSEKKRRDQFNLLVNDLCTMICANSKKMDKSSILKSTISFLKTHNDSALREREHEIKDNWKPSFLSNEEFTYLVLEALEGFTIVLSLSGHIYYVSDGITSLLGHLPANIVNNSIFDLTHEDDRSQLCNLLQNPVSILGPMQYVVLKENEIQFMCLMKRAFGENQTYELMQFTGYFRLNDEKLLEPENSGFTHSHPDSSRLLFVCTGRLYTPRLMCDVSCVDSTRNEFTSRHSLQWKYLFLDHRASPIIGYLPFEVLGTSGYDYYHFDDLEKIVDCHEALMQKGVLTSCYYRFLTKGQQWIWLQSRFYITYHQWNSKPEFIACTHRVISYSDICKNRIQNDIDVFNKPETQPSLSVVPFGPDESMSTLSPSRTCTSVVSDAFSPYHAIPQQASMNTATGAPVEDPTSTIVTPSVSANSWTQISQPPTYYQRGSDTTSVSDDHSDMANQMSGGEKPTIELQHGMGVQFLQSSQIVTNASTIMPLQLPTVSVLMSPELAQQQNMQLSRRETHDKHENLHEVIARQEEELRRVKKQLLYASLGILPPVINMPNQYMPELSDNEKPQHSIQDLTDKYL